MGGVQLTAQEFCTLERTRGLDGKGFQNRNALTQLIDFLSPASLMHLLTMFGELGAVAQGTQFALDLRVVGCGWSDRFGASLG
jgi:hypothetical protein